MNKTLPARQPSARGLRHFDGRIEPTLDPRPVTAPEGPDGRVEPRLGLPVAPPAPRTR